MSVRSIRDIAAAVRGRRQDLGLSQAELSRRAGVSRKWISEFEAGKPTAELGLVLRVLDQLGFRLDLRAESPARPGRDSIDLDTLLEQFNRSSPPGRR
jgi:HTH-type transcriptional regulator / antitoxin HipB